MGLFQTVVRAGGVPPAKGEEAEEREFFEAYDPLRLHDPESGLSRTDAASLDEVGIARVVSTGHDIGVLEQDCVTLLAPRAGRILSETSHGEFRSVPGGALLFWPNQRATRVERGDAPLFTAAALRIPPQAMVAAAASLDLTLAKSLERADIALSLDPARVNGVSFLTDYCDALLRELERAGSLLTRERARKRAAAQINETLIEILESAGALPAPEEVAGVAARRRVRAAESYMRAHYEDIVSITEVSRAVGVSARALQLAFGAVSNQTPREALAAIRLEAARSRLSSPTDGDTVTNVALACGLTHLGRFAITYRERFGESPSVTLQRALGA